MGGVDKADMLLSLYRTCYRSRKWYHRIAFHLFSFAAVNAWLGFQQIGGNESLVNFLGIICFSLIKGSDQSTQNIQETPKSPAYRSLRAYDVPIDIKHIKFDHWPAWLMCQTRKGVKIRTARKKPNYTAQNAKFFCVCPITSALDNIMEFNAETSYSRRYTYQVFYKAT